MRDEIIGWFREHAYPLTPCGSVFGDVDPAIFGHLVGEPAVIGVGVSSRGAHELSALTYGIVQIALEHLGSRSVALDMVADDADRLDQSPGARLRRPSGPAAPTTTEITAPALPCQAAVCAPGDA